MPKSDTTEIFRRTQLAQEMAKRLLKPSALDLGLRSGLFMFGAQGTGKTTFLINDLAPALEEGGALVVYINLCSSPQRSFKDMVEEVIQEALSDWGSEPLGSELDVVIRDLRIPGDATIAEVVKRQVDRSKADVALIIDEAQEATFTIDGQQTLLALKAARDAVNTQSVTPGHFLLIGVCSNQAASIEMTNDQYHAFFGAVSITYPLLERDYVEFLLEQLHQAGHRNLPSLEIAEQLFRAVSNKPRELIRALTQFENDRPLRASSPDEP